MSAKSLLRGFGSTSPGASSTTFLPSCWVVVLLLRCTMSGSRPSTPAWERLSASCQSSQWRFSCVGRRFEVEATPERVLRHQDGSLRRCRVAMLFPWCLVSEISLWYLEVLAHLFLLF